MSSPAVTAPSSLAAAAPAASAPPAGKALAIGIAGIAATLIGFAMDSGRAVGMGWLVGVTFWTGIALGMLLLVMIHHIFDASWSVVIRRQFEHALSAFPYLALMFLPLIIGAIVAPGAVWRWMDSAFDLAGIGGHGTVGSDALWVKKSGFLNRGFFIFLTCVAYAGWTFLSSRFRRNSFAQDNDGDAKWTISSRKWAAAGIPFTALTLTGCIILWIKSLEYHWFSTMYGVWFFAGCMRAALSFGAIVFVWLWYRGDYKGILNNNHLHSIGQLMFAFTVFWAYVTFSQYFLIWNANVPEETFWYNIREMNNSTGEPNQWKYVGMFLIFGHFLFPFLALISYPAKISKVWMRFMGFFISTVFLVDLCYNSLPAMKINTEGDPIPFFSTNLLWVLTSVVGVGGVFVWAYLKSFPTTKLIPIRDPRISECLTYHEPSA